MCSRCRGSMPLNGSSSSRIARVVDERAGELGALAHPLRVRADRPVRGIGQVDRGDGPGGRGVRIGDALQLGVESRELPPGQEGVDRLALRDEPDLAVHRGSPPGALPPTGPCRRTARGARP